MGIAGLKGDFVTWLGINDSPTRGISCFVNCSVGLRRANEDGEGLGVTKDIVGLEIFYNLAILIVCDLVKISELHHAVNFGENPIEHQRMNVSI